MRTDPADTGGMCLGRPGTAPIHFRALPQDRATSTRFLNALDRALVEAPRSSGDRSDEGDADTSTQLRRRGR